MATEENEIKTSEVEYSYNHKDDTLVSYITWANKGVSLAVTLSIKGVLYSGMIIGGARWCDLMAEQLSSSSPSEEATEAINNYFNHIKNERYSSPPDEFDAIEFIHLEAVRVFQGAQQIQTPDTVWRLKVGEVDGYTLGAWK
ncbi:hypothetical protein [Erwinia sp. Leaf53]|uniref:hypothetical protein n=1 Tax=Erwinia sp. Leaf53 TaxID=1736225 RepID=UPI0012E31ABE|nr:hypothetical protein [Erwinia sp. Leaf53]